MNHIDDAFRRENRGRAGEVEASRSSRGMRVSALSVYARSINLRSNVAFRRRGIFVRPSLDTIANRTVKFSARADKGRNIFSDFRFTLHHRTVPRGSPLVYKNPPLIAHPFYLISQTKWIGDEVRR